MGPADLEPQTLRRLLADLLRSDPDFDAFCLDHFPGVHRRFASGMERTQKENLLLVHAPSRAQIVEALRTRFPDAPILKGVTSPVQPRSKRMLRLILGWGVGAGLVAVAVLVGRAAVRPNPQACGALQVDDVFVVKTRGSPQTQQTMLDVRLRHGRSDAAPVNLTRAVVHCLDKTPERSPYTPSASYDLLISGEQSEAAVAQRLAPGEVDRILIRLGYTPETAGYQYTARLKLLYNDGCTVESAPFVLSRDAARYVGLTPY